MHRQYIQCDKIMTGNLIKKISVGLNSHRMDLHIFTSFLTLSISPPDYGDFKDFFFGENNLKAVMNAERTPPF